MLADFGICALRNPDGTFRPIAAAYPARPESAAMLELAPYWLPDELARQYEWHAQYPNLMRYAETTGNQAAMAVPMVAGNRIM